MAVASYEVGSHNEISHTCVGNCDSSSVTVENVVWTSNDSLIEEEAEEVIGEASEYLSDCSEEGCSQCNQAWMSNSPSNIYHVCTDFTVYKFGNKCNTSRHDVSRCATGEDHKFCLWSYDYADPAKFRSETKACRTVPDYYFTNTRRFSRRRQRNTRRGVCPYFPSDCQCYYSWFNDRTVDPGWWRGYSALVVCRNYL